MNSVDVGSKQRKESKRQSKDINMGSDLNSNKKFNVEQNKDVDLNSTDNTEANTDNRSKRAKSRKRDVCVKCSKIKTIYSNLLCSTCYNQHLKEKREEKGRSESKSLIICLKCNLLKRHHARQLCTSCYHFARKSNNLKQYSKKVIEPYFGQKGVCVKCNELKTIYERLMCRLCNNKEQKAKREAGAQRCGNCGKLELVGLNGFCSECNSDKRIRKMADGLIEIDQKSKTTLRNIEESSDPCKYLISTEEFIDRLKEYTRSKLKPLKKQNKLLKVRNADSIFNVTQRENKLIL